MEIGPLQRLRNLSPVARSKASAATAQAAPQDLVAPSRSAEDAAQRPSRASGPPRAALVAISLVGALGSMASLFLGAMGAAAEPAPQAQVQVQVQLANPLADMTSQIVLQGRQGELLGKDRMVKLDPYPGMHTRTLQQGEGAQPLIQGADNFRQIPGTSVYGVSQPSVDGLKGVLRQLGAAPGSSGAPVVWTTLREEPVVYIQGRSYTIRDLKQPFANLESPGASSAEVEARDQQLQREIWQEVERYGGKFLIHEESPDGQLTSRWVELKPEEVQTPAQVFAGLQAEGYRVDYARIPITDEKAPENGDFDALLTRIRGSDPNSPLVFNCHAGRGRTTTGMVVGQIFRNTQSASGQTRTNLDGDQYEQGNYKAVLQLLDQLRDGNLSKEALDAVIDQAGGVQNLRTAIARLKQKSENRATPGPQAHESQLRGKDYLHRYYKLIAFESYLREMAPQGFPQDFSTWLKAHPELDVSPEQLELVYNRVQDLVQYA